MTSKLAAIFGIYINKSVDWAELKPSFTLTNDLLNDYPFGLSVALLQCWQFFDHGFYPAGLFTLARL